MRIGIRRAPDALDVPLPAYMTAEAAGADVCAAVSSEVTLAPGERALVPAGFSLAIPPGYEVQVRPRSGLALKAGVTVLNSPGTIDSDYRGPVGVVLANFGTEPFTIKRGDRIAQMIVAPVVRGEFDETIEHGETDRSTGGFGSTGR